MIKTDKNPENHKFHTLAATLVARYQTTDGPAQVRGPGFGDRWFTGRCILSYAAFHCFVPQV